jgi:LAO/AO transport system kinase
VSDALPSWLTAALAGHRASLARAITAVEEYTADAPAVLQAVFPRIGRALVVGFTGTPGAGKSTLIAACIPEALRRGLSVGVIAVDPSSPLTGGSVLGDRIRMLASTSDGRVYMRSLAARGHLGGLSSAASRVVDVLDAAGKDLVLVESVGIGQSETEISGLAHITVLVCAPGMGDEVQMIKAGVLEVADVFAVNKADQPDAQSLIRQLRAAGHLSTQAAPPVVATTATTGAGVTELLDLLLALHTEHRLPPPQERLRRVRLALQTRALQDVQRRLSAVSDADAERLCNGVLEGTAGFDQAAQALLNQARA